MDPITAVGLVGSVVGVTDIVVRSLSGLRSLQAHYNSADRRVAITRGNLQSVKGALDEIREWAAGLPDGAKTTYASLLQKIDFAVQCCGIPLETLCESIESLRDKVEGGGLSRRGKLAAMLGESELREMSAHLGNQVQALNLLLMAAFCKTQQGVAAVLQAEDTRSVLQQVANDSASYIQPEIESISVMTHRSMASDHDEYLDLSFDFDSELLESQAYRRAFETAIDQRRRRRLEIVTPAAQIQSASGSNVSPHKGQPPSSVHRLSESFSLRPGNSTSGSSIGQAARENQTGDESSDSQPVSNSERLNSLSTFLPQPMSLILTERDREQQHTDVKMLLVGTSDSGKSTLLRQMKLAHKGSYSQDERESFKKPILESMMVNMRCILRAMDHFELPFELLLNRCNAQDICRAPLRTDDTKILCEIKRAIKALWADEGVRAAAKRSGDYRLESSATYWFNEVDRIAQPVYIPTDQDILQARVRNIGISETTFIIGGLGYRIFDMSGSPVRHRKWTSCYENVTVVLFVVDLSYYDQVLYGDWSVNRMEEAMRIFESICNSAWFTKTTLVLWFNKVDIFESKLFASPMRKYFPDYKGGADFDAACYYLLRRFVSLKKDETKPLFAHFGCATDTTQAREFMSSVHDIIVQESAKQSGFS